MNIYSQIPFVKIANNLFLRDSVIISYTTEVADLVGDKIVSRGKYIRTTSKHLSEAAEALGKSLVLTDAKIPFFQYHSGVKLVKPSGLLKDKTSSMVLRRMKEGFSLHESLFLSLLEKKIFGEDRERIERFLDDMGMSEDDKKFAIARKKAAELIL
jgi:hypothetical protein